MLIVARSEVVGAGDNGSRQNLSFEQSTFMWIPAISDFFLSNSYHDWIVTDFYGSFCPTEILNG